jgi:exodeoxyribonuclease V alpha subunit
MSADLREYQPRQLDIHFARFLGERSGLTGGDRARFEELVRLLSLDMAGGHSCLPLMPEDRQLLARCHLVSSGSETPLVLVHDRLYLHRYYRYEARLADQLAGLAGITHTPPDLHDLLAHSFGPDGEEPDFQKKAAEVALHQSLAIISGGPGTGKTTTVVKIIGLLLAVLGNDVRIALAAPTGKAAMRLQESIGASLSGLTFPPEIVDRIPTTASTLHRLLGVRRNRPSFRHTHDNPLPWDVVVVDEASMVDLAMMSKLVDALHPRARLILLGDKDQLASVESGAVLADCTRSLPANTVELQKSYRFNSAIKALAQAINSGDGERVWQLLQDTGHGNVALLRNPYFAVIGARYNDYMEVVARHRECGLHAVFQAFGAFRVLCATRHGQRGVAGVNAAVENHLKRMGYDVTSDPWYLGRPVMVTANDYGLELFNGDIGICLPDPADGRMKVWFERGDGGHRGCLPYRIPSCETVFGMTIHKSQGSEFREVVVMLPEEENRLLNRQLIYTAVTRAKECVQIVASKNILVYALQSDYPRSSGLAAMLRHAGRADGCD